MSYAIHQLNSAGKITMGRYKSYGGMKVEKGLLMRRSQIVIPSSMRRTVFEREHNLHHAGVDKTYQSIRERYFWVGMYTYVQTLCMACEVCQRSKRSYAPKETLQAYDTGDTAPRTTIAMDIATLPWSEEGYRYFLVVVDLFSRYAELVPLKDQMAHTVCEAVKSEWVHRHGPPLRIITDQAHNMDGELMNKLCESLGIEKRRSSPYHPEGDGLAERTIQTIKQLIRCKLQERQLDRTHWPSVLSEIRCIYNSLPNSSTKFQPNELMFGMKLRAPTGVGLEGAGDVTELSVSPKAHVQETRHSQSQLHDKAAQNLEKAGTTSKQYYDQGKKDSNICPGDYVFLRNETRQSSLDPMYAGPFLVLTRQNANVRLRIGGRDKIVHLNRCKKCVPDVRISDSVYIPTGAPVGPDDLSTRREATRIHPSREATGDVDGHSMPLLGDVACDDEDCVFEDGDHVDEDVEGTGEPEPVDGVRRNPRRNRRPPEYLRDYET